MDNEIEVKCKDTKVLVPVSQAYKDPLRDTYYSSEEAYNSRMVRCKDTNKNKPRLECFIVSHEAKLKGKKVVIEEFYSSEEAYSNRDVKCFDTKEDKKASDCYEDTSTAKTRYWSTKEAYNSYKKTNDDRDKCINFVFELFGYTSQNSKLDTRFYGDLETFKDVGFDIVYETMVGEKDRIQWALDNKSFSTQYQAVKYIMAIVNNNIMKYQNKAKEQAKMDAEEELYVNRQRNLMYDDIDINAIGRRR